MSNEARPVPAQEEEQAHSGVVHSKNQRLQNRSHKAHHHSEHGDSSRNDSSHHEYDSSLHDSWQQSSSDHGRAIKHVVQRHESLEDEPNPDEEEEIPTATCMERFKAEINPCQPWFLKKQPEHDRPVDISMSFGPLGCNVLFFKVTGTAFVAGTALYSFIKDKGDKHWWLAYSTSWVLLTGSIYMVMSLFMTLFGAPQPYKRVSSPLVKSAWLLYSFSGHFALLNGLFWWIYIFEPGETRLNWLNFIPHSILPFTIVFDGLNVNHIPLRWQHYTGFVIPMECLYVFWTYSQNVLGDFPNPNVAEDESNDYIYGAFNWDDKETDPLVMSLIGIFIIGPVFWLLMWLFSQYWLICCCLGDRRVYYEDPRKKRQIKARVIEGAGLYRRRSDSDSESEDDEEDPGVSNEVGGGGDDGDHSSGPAKYRNRWEELANAAK